MQPAPVSRQLGDLLREHKDALAEAIPAALRRTIPPDYIIRTVMTSVRKNPGLLECSVTSLAGAVMEAAALGLVPDNTLGLAYFVPFFNSKKGCKEAQLMVGYKGFIALAKRTGDLAKIEADVVYESDHFVVQQGTKSELVHIPAYRGGEVVAAYAVATYSNGASQFEVVPKDELEAVRARSMSASAGKGPWAHPEDVKMMYRKTAIRRLARYLQVSPEMTRASGLDDLAEAGISQDLGRVLDVKPEIHDGGAWADMEAEVPAPKPEKPKPAKKRGRPRKKPAQTASAPPTDDPEALATQGTEVFARAKRAILEAPDTSAVQEIYRRIPLEEKRLLSNAELRSLSELARKREEELRTPKSEDVNEAMYEPGEGDDFPGQDEPGEEG
jgi:recombination protein RecT